MEDTKEAIRKRVLEKRRMVPEVEKKYKSEIIIERLFMQEGYKKSKFVMCYVDFDGEVETRDFILRCIADGKRLAVPMVTKDVSGTRIVIASEVFDPGKDLEKGCFGIHEPKKGAVREINPCEIDLVTVPGVAFDFNKNRIGYGAGLYDRFLKKTANTCFKAGIAFEFQIYENIPAGIYDIPMDIIITEGRLI